ncbi:MAG: Uma2 family endonuclease [Pseudomonadota bacterium]
MSLKTKQRSIPTEEYLAGEMDSDVRHDLVGGQAYAMVGASSLHNLIATGLVRLLGARLADSPCRLFMADMKVRVDNDFYYPDVMVCCNPPAGVYYYVTEPTILIEILSPNTEMRDRLEKRLAYQRLKSLQEYVLIAQDKIRIEIYRRTTDGWELEQYDERDVLRLESLDYSVPVVDIYRDIMNAV